MYVHGRRMDCPTNRKKSWGVEPYHMLELRTLAVSFLWTLSHGSNKGYSCGATILHETKETSYGMGTILTTGAPLFRITFCSISVYCCWKVIVLTYVGSVLFLEALTLPAQCPLAGLSGWVDYGDLLTSITTFPIRIKPPNAPITLQNAPVQFL